MRLRSLFARSTPQDAEPETSVLSTAPLAGTFECRRVPQNLAELGIQDGAGLLLSFTPPSADFASVSSQWQNLSATGRTVITLSSTGALCSHPGRSLYCAQDGLEGSWLWLPDSLIATHEAHVVDLHVGGKATAKERIAMIRGDLERLRIGMELSSEDCFALIFCDGISSSEGFLMQAWYECGKFPCLAIGGSAGGSLDFSGTFIRIGAQTLHGKALVVFCRMAEDKRFAPFKCQNFVPAGKQWLIADADPVTRTVSSVLGPDGNPQPFRQALAEHLGCSPEGIEKHLDGKTFAVQVGDHYFIRSIAAFQPDRIAFFCDLEFGDRLHLMKATDFLEDSRSSWRQFLSGKGKPLAVFLNDCVLRRVGNPAQLPRANFFEELPAAGFSTFGEILGVPINQTLSALVFFDAEDTGNLMSGFAPQYAAYAGHYARRALDRWEALSRMQSSVVAKIQGAISPLAASLPQLEQATARQAEALNATQRQIVSVSESAKAASQAQSRLDGGLDKLEHLSQAISKITGGIYDIADQTNLLALNATIEASRAGEAGKGFAVVASEVRTLAQSSKKQASATGDSIRATLETVTNIRQLAQETVSIMHDLIETSSQASQQITQLDEEARAQCSDMVASLASLHTLTDGMSAMNSVLAQLSKLQELAKNEV